MEEPYGTLQDSDSADSPRGIAFYERNGFRLTGEKRIEDEVVSLLKMERVTESKGETHMTKK